MGETGTGNFSNELVTAETTSVRKSSLSPLKQGARNAVRRTGPLVTDVTAVFSLEQDRPHHIAQSYLNGGESQISDAWPSEICDR